MSGAAIALGSSPATFWMNVVTGEPCASMPTASSTESGPRPPVMSRMASPRSFSCSLRSTTSTPRARTRSSRSGTESTPITR